MNKTFSNYFNTGDTPDIQILDIDHKDYCVVVQPDSAFWTLVNKKKLHNFLFDPKFSQTLSVHAPGFTKEVHTLRYGLSPSAVYVNPTEQCNLNCQYCYIPKEKRKNGKHMDIKTLKEALKILKNFFKEKIEGERKPSIIFHGSEPLLNHEVVFPVIEQYKNDFDFGIQTNATLINDKIKKFIIDNNVGLGISLDGHNESIADAIRKDWIGKGYFSKILNVIDMFKNYERFNVLCTINNKNVMHLKEIIQFFHKLEVKTCMLNILRCTLPDSRSLKPEDSTTSKYFIEALDETFNLYKKTGRKIIVSNFANILLSILAPTARKLMCDISPCGGGRSFFSLSAKGDIFPCSEFIGLEDFNAGNIFNSKIDSILDSEAIKKVSKRKIEDIEDCKSCAIRHFCGSPCPAEAFTLNNKMNAKGAFCKFYEDQVRYAFRLIASGKQNFYLYDDWDKGIKETFSNKYFSES